MKTQGLPIADPLSDFLSGKREFPRYPVSLAVEVAGAHLRLPGRAVDASEGGVLIEVSASLLRTVGDVLATVGTHFGEAFDVHFGGAKMVVEAELVRLTNGDDDVVRLGCRFTHKLSTEQRQKIGIEPTVCSGVEATELEEAPFECLPLEPKSSAQAWVMIFDGSPTIGGPRFVAKVTGLGSSAFTATIDRALRTDVTSILGTEGFAFEMTAAGVRWAGQARLVAARYLDVPGGAVEIALLADDAPSRRLRKTAFQKRA